MTNMVLGALASAGPAFLLPTPNKAIYEPGKEAQYFVPTPGRTWESGTFGCVRSEGWQLHEGLDIKCIERTSKGEPADPIYASAAGKVVYLNSKSGLSNYGKYLILEHEIEGIKVYTTYAHLSEFRDGLSVGTKVKAGEKIATMGRTTNTRTPITKERAHLHFEIGLRVNDNFSAWHRQHLKGQRNDHGDYNGRNFLGLDPREIFLEQQRQGAAFSLLNYIRNQPELCRILIRDTRFSWLRSYTPLVKRNPLAEKQGVAAYEIALNYVGVPIELIPRAPGEIKGEGRVQLLSVNEQIQQQHPCRKLVVKKNGRWELGAAANELISLLTF